MSLSIILPAYKEAENLAALLPVIKDVLKQMPVDSEVLVIDTMEPADNAKSVCESNDCTYVNRTGGNDYGDAMRTGFSLARHEWILVMDADGSHNPEDIPRLYQEAQNGYDLVIGSRYIEGGNSHNGIILKMMSYTVNLIYRIAFRIKLKDISNSFRIYKADKLKAITLECSNFDIVEEILIRLNLKFGGLNAKEIPVYFSKRIHGKSKRDLLRFVFSYISTITKLLKISRQEKRAQKQKQKKNS